MKAVADAEAGDHRARAWLSSLLIPSAEAVELEERLEALRAQFNIDTEGRS